LPTANLDAHGGHTYTDTNVNEHAQLWTGRCWADWMNAKSWPELKAHQTMPPARGEQL
jgi:hypothetical protein